MLTSGQKTVFLLYKSITGRFEIKTCGNSTVGHETGFTGSKIKIRLVKNLLILSNPKCVLSFSFALSLLNASCVGRHFDPTEALPPLRLLG